MSILKNVTVIVLLIATVGLNALPVDSDRVCLFQGDTLPNELKPTRQYGFLGIGFSEVRPKDLNRRLDSTGTLKFEPAGFAVSVGGHVEIRKLILEGSFCGLAWKENVQGNIRKSLYAGNMNGTIGVNLLPEDMNITIAPFAGLGLGANWLRICNDKKTLDQAIIDADPNVSIWQVSFLTQLGVAVDFVVPSPNKQKGFVVGVRTGYQFAPLTSSWYTDDTPITDVPDLKQSGVFAKVVLGGWGPKRNKCKCCR